MAGTIYKAPVRIDAEVDRRTRPASSRWRRCISRIISPPSPRLQNCIRRCRRSPASTRPFTTPSRRSPPPSRCRARLTDEGVRRYGFHGLSYEYIASVLPDIVGPPSAAGRVVVAHLGSGASMCAMKQRKSVATTMGFTALDGLAMGRRCGSLDPGVVLYLMEEKSMTAAAVSDLLYQSSGLSRRFRHQRRHEDVAGERQAACGRGGRSVRLSHLSRARIARGSARRSRCACFHRRHRRARARNSPPGLREIGMARLGDRRSGE